MTWTTKFFDRFVGFATPAELGGIRCWVFFILLVNVIWEDLPSISYLPEQLRVSMGMMNLLHLIPGWDFIYTDYTALLGLKLATIVALVFAMIGWKTRWSVPCGTILALIYGGILREYSHLFHTCLAPLQIAVLLSFMPCGHGLSVDKYLSRKKPADLSHRDLATYGWCRYACWLILAGAYVSAGLSKLRFGGIEWWHGVNLKRIVLTDTLNPMQFEWGLEQALANIPVEIYSLLGIAALLIELLYGLVLFSARARIVFPLLAAGMHLGIWICQGILFFDLILVQAIFFDFSRFSQSSTRLIKAVSFDESKLQSVCQRGFILCLVLLLGLSLSQVMRLECYPASAWQMYSSNNRSGMIYYTKFWAVFTDGHKQEAPIERWVGALADTRYRDVLHRKKPHQEAFFGKIIEVANRASEDKEIARFEVITYRWHFLAYPNDPEFGSVYGIRRYPATDARHARLDRD